MPKYAITYKRGWSFEWTNHNGEDFLNITVDRPDAKGTDSVTGEPRTVTFMLLPPVDDFRYWLSKQIHEIEDHEIDEWLRVDGVLVRDRHAEPDSYTNAIRKVLKDAPPEGISAVGIRQAMSERWPGAFPYVTVLDIADELPIIAERR